MVGISGTIDRKSVVSAAVGLAALLATPTPAAAQAVTGQAAPVAHVAGESGLAPPLRVDCAAGIGRTDRFGNGLSYSRRCIVGHLREHRRAGMIATDYPNEDLRWPQLLADSETLRDFYLARSDRSQAFQDGAATAAGVGGLGASLSTGAAAVAPWGYLALAGVLAVNFTGSQPMRDLFYAGHLGVGYVENRYLVLVNRTNALGRIPAVAGCNRTEVVNKLGVVEGWPDAADRAAFLPVLRQIHDVCARVEDGENQIQDMTGNLAVANDLWPSAFADDLLALDGKLDRADVQLRPTPGSALSSAASGTLRALDSLISGQSSQEAVNRVRINTLLDNMTVDLTPVRVGSAPPQIATRVVLSPDLLARSAVTGRPAARTPARAGTPTPRAPSDGDIGAMVQWMRTQQPVVEAARRRHNERAFLAAEIEDAARRSVLRFDYNVDSGMASVGLETPAAPAPAPVPAAPQPEVLPPVAPPK
ncbi:MAG: hypothetical protein M3Q74_00645 [Pseudomonadota bacterium]|nr:hypothetical protein [Pseudomonadota bacterium]